MRNISVPSPRSTRLVAARSQQSQHRTGGDTANADVIAIDVAQLGEDHHPGRQILRHGTHPDAIRHLDMRITLPLAFRHAAAIVRALRQCTRLQCLVLRCEGQASADAVSALCQHVADHDARLETFSLSFEGSTTSMAPGPVDGMKNLLCKPGLGQLHCRGVVAADAALRSLAELPPDACTLDLLTISGIDPADADAFGQLIAGLHPSNPRIALQIDATGRSGDCVEIDNSPDDLTPDEQALIDAELDRLIEEFSSDGELDHERLLDHCTKIGDGGAEIFAWVCAAQPSPKGRFPVVPVGSGDYLDALEQLQVQHAVRCCFPSDLAALAACDRPRITAMEFEFERALDLSAPALVQLGPLMQQMTGLRNCMFRQSEPTTIGFVQWLCSCLAAIPACAINRICFSFRGQIDTRACPAIVQLVETAPLWVVRCQGAFMSSLVMHALQHVNPEDNSLLVVQLASLPQTSAPRAVKWMTGVNAPNTVVDMSFKDLDEPEALIAQFGELANEDPVGFRVGWLSIGTEKPQERKWPPIDSLLARTLARHGATEAMLSQEEERDKLHPKEQILRAFAQSLAGGQLLADLFSSGMLGQHLDIPDVESIGRTTKATNERARYHRVRGAQLWLASVARRGYLTRGDALRLLAPRVGIATAENLVARIWG